MSFSFNSATASQLWRLGLVKEIAATLKASIRPQLLSCGDNWPSTGIAWNTRASIRPQLLSCGNVQSAFAGDKSGCFNSATASQLWKLKFASGCVRVKWSFNSATASQLWKQVGTEDIGRMVVKLQFGHSFSAVETSANITLSPTPGALQFGHSFSAVETMSF